MDTKWNSTNDAEYFVSPEPRRKGAGVKAWAAFLAFFLGVSLTLSALGQTACRLVWERDLTPRWTADWQETESFRTEAAALLRDFLVLGAGGTPGGYGEWYGEWYGDWSGEWYLEQEVMQSFAENTWAAVPGWGGMTADSAVIDKGAAPVQVRPLGDPDADYQDDKNVLYIIRGGTGENARHYTNTDAKEAQFQSQSIEGCSFYLTFQNGRVSIVKDGQQLDVYGDGYYEGGSQWFVPGYVNFPAGKELEDVTVYMAVREAPIRYYSRDYQTGQTRYLSSMYYLAQRVEESRSFYRQQAAVLGCGALCLLAWALLRKARPLADAKIASWTVHIWTEGRVLAALVLLLWMLGGSNWENLYWQWQELWWSWYDGSGLWMGQLVCGVLAFLLSCFPALLVLGWLGWLIRNDHNYNPREARRSLLSPFFRALAARGRPVEKRLSRILAAGAAALTAAAAACCFFLVHMLLNLRYYGGLWTALTILLALIFLALLGLTVSAWRSLGLGEDLGRLAGQVEAVRAGELGRPLDLPANADLRRTAESLNDIQAGMRAALEEQTRSERMKVELISNVSHDLKTPLTSILSYAELLRQEELSPAAADYARVIDEKAQRLKGMVQDVFEVSKAAADQLPVHLERLDLGKLLRQTLADMDGPIGESALTFRADLPEGEVMIVADGRRLYRVFQNLIDNALRYALEGSRVYLTLTVRQSRAEAAVRNTSRTELPKGVDFTARFVRGDASRTDGGSGLGLSIARSFTEACGGSFRVETVADLFTAVAAFPLAEETRGDGTIA